MTLEIGPPVEATEIPPKRATGREYGPNLFLDNGWLEQSYNADKWYDVPPVDGAWVKVTATRGKGKGVDLVDKLTGTAAEVVRQLREAAEELGIGVSIKYAKPVHKTGAKKGQEIEGQLIVKYLGTVRKQRQDKADEAAEEVAENTPVTG